jgi:predicted lipoprotein with Yx(FWY)xxD motif
MPAGEDRDEAQGDYRVHSRDDEEVRAQAGEGDAMKILRHGKRQTDLNGGGNYDHLDGEE